MPSRDTEELRVLHRSPEARHQAILAEAARLGIDEEFIATLVDRFYDRIRADSLLGPVFNRAIGDGWGPHLATMKDFWASVAMDAGRYDGRPVPAHLKVEGIEQAHFGHWLGLFRQTLEELTANPATIAYFLSRAERIAQSLQWAIFGLPLTNHRAG